MPACSSDRVGKHASILSNHNIVVSIINVPNASDLAMLFLTIKKIIVIERGKTTPLPTTYLINSS